MKGENNVTERVVGGVDTYLHRQVALSTPKHGGGAPASFEVGCIKCNSSQLTFRHDSFWGSLLRTVILTNQKLLHKVVETLFWNPNIP